MFAILAALAFALAFFGVMPGGYNLAVLGLALLTLHFIAGPWPLNLAGRRRSE